MRNRANEIFFDDDCLTLLLVSEAQGKKATGGSWDSTLQGGAVAGILFPLGGTQVLKGDPKHK